MKRVTALMLCLLWVAGFACSQGGATAGTKPDNTELIRQYYQERKLISAELKTNHDDKYLNLLHQDNLKKGVIRDKYAAQHPDFAKIKDPQVRQEKLSAYIQQLRKAGDKSYLEFAQVRRELDKYLMSKSPRMTEIYNQMPPALQEQLGPGKE